MKRFKKLFAVLGVITVFLVMTGFVSKPLFKTIRVMAAGAAESIYDRVDSPFPQWFLKGIYIGSAAANPVSSTANKLTGVFQTPKPGFGTSFSTDGGVPFQQANVPVAGAQPGDVCHASLSVIDAGTGVCPWATGCSITSAGVASVFINSTGDAGTVAGNAVAANVSVVDFSNQ